ncbi:MAG: nucleotide sugar dehydrogenase [Ignavibacteriales bacterium]|nr:nucleotide sugar dehydrogenase [Ignavibacteriales bacterium]
MNYKSNLLKKINNKSAVIGIIGLGYVGLPLALTFAEKGFKVIGFDIDENKIPILNSGKSYIKHISSSRIKLARRSSGGYQVSRNKFEATFDFSRLTSCDCILICVPTPLNDKHEPDISFVENSAKSVAEYLRPGQLIVLESSTYPGTTEEILLPLFNKKLSPLGGDKEGAGTLFFLAFSPEREDPGNKKYNTSTIPKLVGGYTPNCLKVSCALYNQAIKHVIPVSSCKVAESAKLLENIYRSVNIALVNELKIVFDKMGIDVWDVIEAAKTKPFGFQAFYPGPGLGGHCIPIDPFYLSWKAKEFGVETKFIELAGKINTQMPYYVVQKTIELLNDKRITINGAKILILGASYKKNIDDLRESPALKLIEILKEKGAEVDYYDPYVPELPKTRKYNFKLKSIRLNQASKPCSDPDLSGEGTLMQSYDLVILATDHDIFDYKLLTANCRLIIDTRNAFERKGIKSKNIHKA